jgi:hypothetical protein
MCSPFIPLKRTYVYVFGYMVYALLWQAIVIVKYLYKIENKILPGSPLPLPFMVSVCNAILKFKDLPVFGYHHSELAWSYESGRVGSYERHP